MNGVNYRFIFGNGKGKTTAAPGQAIKEASKGKTVIIVQFFKAESSRRRSKASSSGWSWRSKLLFRFQRKEAAFEDLSDQERKEEHPEYEERPELCQKGVGNGGMRCAGSG